ncbi:putative ABC-type dipeptide transport system, periplasmic component [uncultured Eubacteriales bacterium]|uniref:Putative ABC-type dipeptide transport system, periplasmic component n=1 Tax=uncultured Eubacteriales bacterium TaxID=172733 RepID=A0A212J1W0_9FIRM|nr:putative ABC-type dipeptide transport system, periplasmic component [uncultured Eubacteriales bacterium]
MKFEKKRTLSLITAILTVILIFSFTGCAPAAPTATPGSAVPSTPATTSGTPTTSKVINIGITNDPATVNPLAANNVFASTASRLLFLPLAALNEDLGFTYQLAESITTEDNQLFTVKLNPNVKWTDGNPVTTDDVLFSLGIYTNPDVGAQSPSTYNTIVGTDNAGLNISGSEVPEGAKKVDDTTLTIETKYPITLDIFNLTVGQSLRTLPKHILGQEDPKSIIKSAFLQAPNVTNGPFTFKEYVAGQYLSYEANEDYYLGAPKINTLNFKILSGTQITAQLESGEIDMNFPLVGNIPYDDYERVRSLANVRTEEGIPSNVQVLFINSQVVDNVKVRQAMSLAIDRDSILQNILKGDGYITKTPVTNRIQYWNEEAAAPEYDIEKAKQLLAESGWDLSKELVFSVPTGNTTREKVGTIIAESLKSIGLNVTIQKADLATTLGNVQKSNYDLSIIGMPDVPLNIISYLRVYASTKYTWTQYSNPVADGLVDTILSSVDDQVLKSSYLELQQLIADEVPVAGLYSEHALRAINKRVTYGELKEYGALLDVEKWDVE